MSAKQIGPVLKAWYRWKSLRLPWRKRFLVGLDLQGNTYWEFRIRGVDASSPNPSSRHRRFRRIVQYPRLTHYSEVEVPPQWHQWLRYSREDPPTLREQSADVARRERVRALAAEADARWAAKPSLLDMPTPPGGSKRQPAPALDTEGIRPREREQGWHVAREHDEGDQGRRKDAAPAPASSSPQPRENPWKRPQGGPSEKWQPAAWTPSAAPRKR
ncbi:hypothetical protein F5X99DRAFT_240258 [Biscogniauxia marginata]|nr:hypothetical protein F5X99DRAFT_240258 [Biscogniauxia marginata]